jgi:hypothetical protein
LANPPGACRDLLKLDNAKAISKMNRPVVFISYSYKDEKEKDVLLSHLDVLQRIGLIQLWSDDQIQPGDIWEMEVDQIINQAEIAILLITTNFLTSDFILGKQVPGLLQQRNQKGLVIYSLIAKACAWRTVDWLTETNIRPRNGKPIWGEAGLYVDEELATMAEELASIIRNEKVNSATPSSSETADDRYNEAKRIPAEVKIERDSLVRSYNLKNIRTLLTEGFTEEELRRLCYDVAEFRPVYDQLAQNTGKARIVDYLLEYAERKLLLEVLLTLVKTQIPARYDRHQPYY